MVKEIIGKRHYKNRIGKALLSSRGHSSPEDLSLTLWIQTIICTDSTEIVAGLAKLDKLHHN